MWKLISIENLKLYLIVIAIIAAVWFFKDYQFQKAENIRQTDNNEQLRKMDSLNYAKQVLTKREFDEYLEYNRQDLQEFLKTERIRANRIEQIITQSLKYRDTASKKVDLNPILEAIKEKRSIKVPVIDSTKCMIIKGYVAFENDTLTLDITDRQFKNRSDVISYWERNQWRFLGIRTRLFGKKKATVIIKDDCGNTETFEIEKK